MGLDLTRAGWRMLAASVAGTAHVRSGHPCADASAVRLVAREKQPALLVAVAADGAGTSARAAEGARIACDAIVAAAEGWARGPRKRGRGSRAARGEARELSAFTREDMVRFVELARGRILAAARRESLDRREFSCTLLVALVDGRSAVFFQIGDGAIVYQSEDGRYVPALWPQSGEYANCTWFLTDDDAAARVQARKARGVHEVALLTDGLQGLALRFRSREAHGPFFAPMFARLRHERAARPRRLAGELRSFLDSPAVNLRTDDDKTLVMATRLPASRNGHEPERADDSGRAK
jgi:hypothetical protein